MLDAAIQLWILRGAGLDIRDTCIMTLDNRFVRTATPPDPHKLFRLHHIHTQTEALLGAVGADVRTMHEVVAKASPPQIDVGDHCQTPYPCSYYAHCSRNEPSHDHGLSELPSVLERLRTGQLNQVWWRRCSAS